MTRLARGARPRDVERVAGRALEAAVLLTHVGEGVVERPAEALRERRREEADAKLLALAPQVAAQLVHAVEQWRDASVARRDGTRGRDDAPRLRVHHTPGLLGEREPLR